MNWTDWLGMALLQVALVLINAFFAATEIAVLQLNANKLRKMAEDGNRAAPRILRMVEEPGDFLSTIQIGITLGNLLSSAFAASNFAAPLAAWVHGGLGWTFFSLSAWNSIAIIVVTLLLSYVMLVLGELVPKQVALHKPFEVARITSGIISGMAVVGKPLVSLLSASSRFVLRILGMPPELAQEVVTEDEIRMMVDVGLESGAIDSEEKEMIENVFELDKTIARDVMTHRVDVVTLPLKSTREEVVNTIIESGLSRIPVYDSDPDDIIGVLSTRLYLLNLREEKPKKMKDLLRPAYFVPETVPVPTLLREMQQRKDHLALLVDEYGGFAGLVAMEDIIEEIVGNIYDEFDQPDEPEYSVLGENLWRVEGDTEIETLEELLDVKFPEDREYDTLGGLVFSCMTSIPADGTIVTVETNGLRIVTDPIMDRHIERAKVSLLEPGDAAAEEGGEKAPQQEKTK